MVGEIYHDGRPVVNGPGVCVLLEVTGDEGIGSLYSFAKQLLLHDVILGYDCNYDECWIRVLVRN